MNLVDNPNVKEAAVEFITAFLIKHGYAPSMRDIQRGLGLGSVSTVRTLLSRLRRDGIVEYEDKVARSVRIPWE